MADGRWQVWVYYSAQIFFFGAEFTQVYANKHGARIEPARSAVRMIEQMRARPETARVEEAGQVGQGGSTSPAAPHAGGVVQAGEQAGAQPEHRIKRERYTAAVIGAGLGVLGAILVGLLGPLIGIGSGSRKKEKR